MVRKKEDIEGMCLWRMIGHLEIAHIDQITNREEGIGGRVRVRLHKSLTVMSINFF